MNIKKGIKKGLNILLCFSIVIILTMSYSHKAYADALSATVFLGESAATAATGGLVGTLLAPEVIIPMALTALGVAGLGYVVGKYDIINQVVADIRSANESFLKEVRGADGAIRTYVKGYYQNAKSYLDEGLLEIIAKSGINQGLFEGVTGGNIGMVNSSTVPDIGEPYKINSLINYEEFATYVKNTIRTINNSMNNTQYQRVIDLLDYCRGVTGNNNIFYITYNPGGANICMEYMANYNMPIEGTIRGYAGSNIGIGKTFEFEESISVERYAIKNSTGVIEKISNSTFRSFPLGWGGTANSAATCSNIGLIREDVTGIPVTDNIPYELNLSILLPDWAYPELDDLLPVSLPWGYDIPAVYPPDIPAIPDALPIPLPDFAFPDYPDDPADPDEEAQDKAQRGSADSVTEDGAADLPLVSDAELFERLKLPAVIRTKFPFCLFYDVYDIYYCLFYGSNPDSARMGFDIDRKDFAIIGDTSASENNIDAASGRSLAREAPHYEWEVPNVSGFSNTENIVIDLSEYDDVAQIFRTVIFILFSISIAKGLVDAYKGTFGSVNISPWSW